MSYDDDVRAVNSIRDEIFGMLVKARRAMGSSKAEIAYARTHPVG
jgi:hypothetical protein